MTGTGKLNPRAVDAAFLGRVATRDRVGMTRSMTDSLVRCMSFPALSRMRGVVLTLPA